MTNINNDKGGKPRPPQAIQFENRYVSSRVLITPNGLIFTNDNKEVVAYALEASKNADRKKVTMAQYVINKNAKLYNLWKEGK